MKTAGIVGLALCGLGMGCSPSAPAPEATAVVATPSTAPEPQGAAIQKLRVAMGNLESYLADLEGKLRGATAESWSQDASAAQHIVGNLRIELEAIKRGLNEASPAR